MYFDWNTRSYLWHQAIFRIFQIFVWFNASFCKAEFTIHFIHNLRSGIVRIFAQSIGSQAVFLNFAKLPLNFGVGYLFIRNR